MTQQTTQLRFDTIPPREEWKYELYGLPYNPFQVAGLAELVPTLPIYRLDVANEIRDYVSSTFKKQEYGGLLVRGEYGMGKSHLLRYMTNQINVQLGTRGSERAIAIYVENPETSMEGLISRLIESLERKTIEQLAWNILVKRLRKIGAQGLLDRIPSSLFVGTVTGPRLQEILTMHLLNRERFLEEWSALFYGDREYEHLRKVAQEELSGIFQHPDMVDLFCDLLFGGEFTSYKAYHGLVQMRGKTKITTVVRPERLFGEILELFRMNEYREVYILIDEFEDIHMKLSKAKLTQYLSEFRSLIDNNIKYCAFAIAMVPSAWETLEEVQPAFAERFSRRVDLLPLSDEQVQAVLTGYLRRAMSSVDVDVVSEVEATLVFDVEAISEINRVQGGNIRAIVELCHRLIEHGVSRGVKPITAGFVQMIARSTGD